jgi:hypothetical protein
MNHKGRRMCIRSALRLHITHLLQRTIFSTTVHDRLSIRGVLWCYKPLRSKKHTFFIWTPIISWRRILYQKDDWLLVCWTTLLLHTGRIIGLFNCDGIKKIVVVADFLSWCTRNDATSQDSCLQTENRTWCLLNAKQKGWRLNSNIRVPPKKLSYPFVRHKGLWGNGSYS